MFLKVANFFLPYLCSVFLLLGRKPVVQIYSTNYARFSCLFLLGLCINIYCVTLGNVVRVYPWIVQGLTFYQHKNIYITIILAHVVQVDAFLL